MPERISALHRITTSMLWSLELDGLLPEIVRAVKVLARADAASVMLVDEAAGALRVVAQDGLTARYAESRRFGLDRARAMYKGFDTHVAVDLAKEATPGDAQLIADGFAQVVAMPLAHEGRLIGSISAYSRDAAWGLDPIGLDILHILGAQASIAITNARLYDAERQARRLQESLLESLGDAVVIAFTEGPLRMNHAARVAFGIDRAELPDRHTLRDSFELRTEDGTIVPGGASPLDRALRGEPSTGTYRQRDLRRGVERTYRFVGAPVHGTNGSVAAGIVAMHDVTEQAESERQKDEFLSIVSHELKTPLTPLKALAQLLRLRLRRHRQDGRPLDLDSLDTNLITIERQVDRMAGLVNDLLEVSRAGRGRFELQSQEFDVVPLVREVVQRHSEVAAEDGRHTFELDAPASLSVVGDTMRIEQAVTNLVGNAVKYSPSGGPVRVAVQPDGDAVVISVADAGIGIGADELPGLAKPFARGSRRARTFSGMGIGLYLARLVAEGHGGSLAIASPGEGQGTTVTLTLPRNGSKR
ncbi:MAG TPA: ATP-binding protein [Candidatus Limnocylindria bacterium]|nr:ATP-binding protein [Candidatus Limnocylindria bacterium]